MTTSRRRNSTLSIPLSALADALAGSDTIVRRVVVGDAGAVAVSYPGFRKDPERWSRVTAAV